MFEMPGWLTPLIIVLAFPTGIYVVVWTFGMLMFIWKTPEDQLREMIKPRSQRIKEALDYAANSVKRPDRD